MKHGHCHRRSPPAVRYVFWDRKGILLTELMTPWTTITSEVYCETLNKLRRLIKKKTARDDHYRRRSPARQRTAPHRSSHKCCNQALQLGDFRPLFLQSGPGAKRLPSLHQEGRSGWLPSASTPTKSSWMESTTGCITRRYLSLMRDYKN